MHDNNSNSKAQLITNPVKSLIKTNKIQMLDQFHLACHPCIIGVADVKADGHCGYRAIVALLGIGEESWSLVRMDLYKELCEWRDVYAIIVGGSERLKVLKKSLLVADIEMVSYYCTYIIVVMICYMLTYCFCLI